MKTACQKTLSRIMQYVVVWLVVFGLFALQPARADKGNISTSDKYAWSENVGWIHFKNDTPAYGVNTTFTPAGEVTIKKTQSAGDTVLPGENFFYTLTIQNGYQRAVDMLIEDFVSKNVTSGFFEVYKDHVLVDDGDLAGNDLSYRTEMTGVQELRITFQVTVKDLVSAGSLILNQAFVTVFSAGTNLEIGHAASNIVQTKVVPEPGTVFLFGIRLIGVLGLLRRRRKRRT